MINKVYNFTRFVQNWMRTCPKQGMLLWAERRNVMLTSHYIKSSYGQDAIVVGILKYKEFRPNNYQFLDASNIFLLLEWVIVLLKRVHFA